jgi:ferredoxin
MKVWIDQDLCTGDGLCTEICPVVFEMYDDGLAYVKNTVPELGATALLGDDGKPIHKFAIGTVTVSPEFENSVIEAEAECPGECIFIENEDD